MADPLGIRDIKFESFQLPPLDRARLEIMGLASVPELSSQRMVGGHTPPEVVVENARRQKERRRRELAIIEKYGVADEYLKPLLEQEKRLEAELVEVRERVAGLKALQKK